MVDLRAKNEELCDKWDAVYVPEKDGPYVGVPTIWPNSPVSLCLDGDFTLEGLKEIVAAWGAMGA